MSNARPNRWYRWATDPGADLTEPLEALKDSGYSMSDKPNHGNWNWKQNLIGQTLTYLDLSRAEYSEIPGATGAFRVTGLTLAQVAGLQGSLSPGIAYNEGQRIQLTAQELTDSGDGTHNYTSSTDTWVTLDPVLKATDPLNAVSYYEVAIGDPEPVYDTSTEFAIGKVRTDATDIISIDQTMASGDFADHNGPAIRYQQKVYLGQIDDSESTLDVDDRLIIGDTASGDDQYINMSADAAAEMGLSFNFPGFNQEHGIYCQDGFLAFRAANTQYVCSNGALFPADEGEQDLGSGENNRWRHLYCENIEQHSADTTSPCKVKRGITNKIPLSGNQANTNIFKIPTVGETSGILKVWVFAMHQGNVSNRYTDHREYGYADPDGVILLDASAFTSLSRNETGEVLSVGVVAASNGLNININQTTTRTYDWVVFWEVVQMTMT